MKKFWLGFAVCYFIAGLGQAMAVQQIPAATGWASVFGLVAWPMLYFIPVEWWASSISPYLFNV